MLLTCPACSTRYEVPASVLPAEGRLVRCSACRAEWLAKPSGVKARPAPAAADPAPAEVAVSPEPPAKAAPVSATPAPEPAAPFVQAAPVPAPPEPKAADTVSTGATPRPVPSATRETASGAPVAASRPPQGTARALASSIEDDEPARSGSGFLAGFASVSVIALLGVTVYLKHEALGQAVPALAEPLSAYVAAIDSGRGELARLLESLQR
jgi:predicted Zn finger-like uncharacterized protein